MNATTNEVLEFSDSQAAFGHAAKQARYSHRTWLVWCNAASGTWHAARMTFAAAERANAESPEKFFGMHGDGVNVRYRPAAAQLLLANLKAGHL